MSSMPTNSLSVKLFVFNFCLVDTEIGKPLPIVNPPPVCPRMFGWTANDASTYHMSIPSLSAPSMRGLSLSPLRYSTKWLSFSQSSMSGDLTLMVRNAMARLISGLALLVTYNAFVPIVWKAAAASLDNYLQSSLTTKRLSGAVLALERCLPTTSYLSLWSLEGQVVCLKYSINVIMHGDLVLPLVGEIQRHI